MCACVCVHERERLETEDGAGSEWGKIRDEGKGTGAEEGAKRPSG